MKLEGYFVNQEMITNNSEGDDLLVFLHGQRTGGSAFRAKVLREVFSEDRVYAYQYVDTWKKWDHVDEGDVEGFDVFVGHNDFLKRELSRKTMFISIIRHPFYRFVSLYNYVRNRRDSPYRKLALDYEMGDFLMKMMETSTSSNKYVSNLQCRRVCGSPDFETARRFIEERYFAVGCTERLSDFGDFISDLYDKKIQALDRIDSDHNRYFNALVDKELVGIVLRNNLEDEKLFWYLNQNYFGLPDQNYPWTKDWSKDNSIFNKN